LKNFSLHLFSPPAERTKVRGAVKFFSSSSSLSTPRERTKVRGAVKFFSSSFFPLRFAGEGKGEGFS
jgi:hypothetical protein